MKPNQLKVLQFVATHPGTWSKAFPFGYAFRFDAPEYKEGSVQEADAVVAD